MMLVDLILRKFIDESTEKHATLIIHGNIFECCNHVRLSGYCPGIRGQSTKGENDGSHTRESIHKSTAIASQLGWPNNRKGNED